MAGIIIQNFEEYLRASYAHLNSTLMNHDGSTSSNYTKVNESAIDAAKKQTDQGVGRSSIQ